MVASLACVDFVVLNDESDAITMIREVKPNVYFKGDEYKFENSDVSGMIMKERLAVEELGGEIRYSSELTFSSSNIAKKTFSKLSEEVQEYLVDTEQKFKIDQLHDITKRLKNRKVLVIGEVIIDEYTYVSGLGKPSKENIISTLYDHSEQFMGGVLPIVNTIAEFSNDVDLLTLVGSG